MGRMTIAASILSWGAIAVAGSGCSSGAGQPHAGSELFGRATLALQLTPPSVRCVSFQVSNGTASVTESFSVTPESPPQFELTGLPLGTDTFQASAFAASCSAVGSASPTFTSAPATATVAIGSSPTVGLVMQAVVDAGGGASVTVTFPQPGSGVTLTEFTSTIGSTDGLGLGPDGNLWVPMDTKIASVTVTGSFTGFPYPATSATGGPTGMVTPGSDGNVWFTNNGNVTANPPVPSQLVRVSTDGTRFAFFNAPLITSSSFSRFAGLTTGPDGAIWVVDWGQDYIFRFSTEGIVTGQFPVPNLFTTFTNIVVGPDGNLWFTESSAVAQLTLSGTVTEFPVGGFPGMRIAAGRDGNLWAPVLPMAGPGYGIAKISVAGNVLALYPLPSTRAEPMDIAAGPDGNVWFSEGNSAPNSPNNVCRITPDGTVTEFQVSGFARGITAGPDGAVWFSEDSAFVGRIKP